MSTHGKAVAVLLFTTLAMGGCGQGEDGGAMPSDSVAFAVATDFATAGVASTLAIPELTVRQGAVAGVASTDPVVRQMDGRVYVINRFGQDNVTVLDGGSLQLVEQISTGAGSNPQDVVAMGDRLYVPTMEGSGVAILDVTMPSSGPVDTIDLSSYDSEDGVPNCNSAVRSGDYLVVVCGVLDDEAFFAPRGAGVVISIDLSNDSVVDDVMLANPRPIGFALTAGAGSELDGDVLIATSPDFADLAGSGCVERIEVASDGMLSNAGCLVDNETLGGFASALTYDGRTDSVWMAVTESYDDTDFGPRGYAAAWRMSPGEMESAFTDQDYRPLDIAVCPSGHIVTSEFAVGLRVYGEAADGELTTEPIDIGLPPVTGGLVCL